MLVDIVTNLTTLLLSLLLVLLLIMAVSRRLIMVEVKERDRLIMVVCHLWLSCLL